MQPDLAVTVGSRVVVVKDKGTVRYVGEVVDQPGTWVGIEWDDPSRGKYDGTLGGKSYFKTVHPTGGSFIRLEKVRCGTTILDALQTRYKSNVTEDADMFVETSTRRHVRVELVGTAEIHNRQSQLQLLTTASLVDHSVSSVGNPALLQQQACKLQELDLTGNLLGSWATVMELCCALPQLAVVNLSENLLQLPSALSQITWSPAMGLQALVLNDCRVSWQQVLMLDGSLPNLKELHLCGNAITSLEPPPELGHTFLQDTAFRNLQILDLEDNKIAAWSEILRLSYLRALRKLHLSNNPISNITYPAASSAGVAFPSLEALLLGQCQLASWSAIDQLDAFPALKELRLTGNPLFVDVKGAGRFMIIARVGKLTLLNATDVRPRERRDAEIQFLQNVMSETLAIKDPEERARVEASHPRLSYLQQRHGNVIGTLVGNFQQGTVLSAATASVTLRAVGGPCDGKAVTKKLPRSISIANLRQLLEKLLKIPADEQQLMLKVVPGEVPEDIGHDDTETLAFYDVQDGSEIMVQELSHR